MPDIKKIGLSVAVITSAALGVSSCSMIPILDGSPVSDNMKYRSNDASIKALSIPPGLTKPVFDNSYALDKSGNPESVVQQSGDNVNVVGRGSSTQEMLNSQSVPAQATSSSTVAPVVQKPASPASVAKTTPTPLSRTQVIMTKVKSGEPALAVNAPASNTWSRLPGMLKQVGFDVVKRQPERGMYTITYKGDPSAAGRSSLSRLLDAVEGLSLKSDQEKAAKSGSLLKVGETYLVLVVGNDKQQSFVGVRNSAGKPVDPAVANYVLGLLKGQYER